MSRQKAATAAGEIYPVPPRIPRAPLSLFISITSRCNLACRHCAVYGDGLSYGPDLTTSQWLSFIDHIADLKVFRVKISGGEPFARQDIFTILDHLFSKPIRFSLNTNAVLIDAGAAGRLRRYGEKLSDVMVSLDGGTEQVHDALRGPGAFRAMEEGLGHLVRQIGRVSAYCTVTRLNFRRLEEVVRLAGELGIRGVKFNELITLGRGHDNRGELGLSAEERREVTASLRELKEANPTISGTFLEIEDIFATIRSVCAEKENPADADINCLSGCGALRTECAIRPDGFATPCDRLTELVAGNVLDTGLDEIWRKSPLFQEFRARFVTPVASLPTCTDCRYAPYCTGGCAASALAASGTTLARDPSCCLRLREEEDSYASR